LICREPSAKRFPGFKCRPQAGGGCDRRHGLKRQPRNKEIREAMGKLILICAIAYLAGSVNFAIIFFKFAGKRDPRLSFSGNAGTTNIYRQAGLLWAVIIFLLDIGRAVAVAVLAVYWLPASLIPWAGFFLVSGNSYPCFHGFYGGKGVANYLGFSLFVTPWPACLSAVIWLAVYGFCRIPFVASFFMIFTLAVGQAYFFGWAFSAVAGSTATFVLILLNHRRNIIKIWKSKKARTPGE
jgi:acyl phosphate:glycerol-3-phosphate acyltransferase